jgi:nucleoside-diphosphate-sugar epimerase
MKRTPRSLRTQYRALGQNVPKVAIDAACAALAMSLAFILRYDGAMPPEYLRLASWLVVGVAVFKPMLNLSLGSYRNLWRYTSIPEVTVLLIGTMVAAAVLGALRILSVAAIPFSIIVMDGALYFLATGGARTLRRLQVGLWRRRISSAQKGSEGEDQLGSRIRTIFVGAGDTAYSLLRDLERTPERQWEVLGLLDDDPSKLGQRLCGYEVLGPTTELQRLVRSNNVAHVVIAMPSAEREVVRGVVSHAQMAGATVQSAPSLERLLRAGLSEGDITNGTNGEAPPLAEKRVLKLTDLIDSVEVKKTLQQRLSRSERTKRVLVTGGAGFIGSHLVRRLLDAGYFVRVLDDFTFGNGALRLLDGHPQLEVVQGDISSIRNVSACVNDVSRVIALAAIVGDPACGLNAEETLNLNYESTKVLAETCNFYGVERLVFASSCSVYGASHDKLLDEESPLNPVSLYARTRIMSEEVVFDRCGDVEPVILRFATVFGLSPRMRFDLVVNTLTVRAIVTGRISIFGGEQWRPFVHCQDAANALLLAATSPVERIAGRTFNVGSDDLNYTISEVGRIVAEEIGGVEIEYVDTDDDLRDYRVSFQKIRDEMGFQTSYDLRRGIREMADAIRATPKLQDYSAPIFSNVMVMQERGDALLV